MNIRDWLKEQQRRECQRLEGEIQMFLKMGFELHEITMVHEPGKVWKETASHMAWQDDPATYIVPNTMVEH